MANLDAQSRTRGRSTEVAAARWLIGGRIQGVGFRPFVYRLAHRLGLSGWVRNRHGCVEVFAQGETRHLEALTRALVGQAPPFARPRLLERVAARPRPLAGFEIRRSLGQLPAGGHAGGIHVPPDLCVCEDCLRELRTPGDRRHRYPFINCTQCGPRYTVITALPYDRANTTLSGFTLCADCAAEYHEPLDRRFHAQPTACPACGPRLRFFARNGVARAEGEPALAACLAVLRDGGIVAVKGVGGYHLMCDARSAAVVARLRRVKPRPHKPLAVMFPMEAGLDTLRACTRLTPAHEAALRAPSRPIVLVPRREDAPLAAEIAPGLDEIGALLPYSPLHHLLLDAFAAPLVATSANVSGDPVEFEAPQAEARLSHVADAWLHHDRPIRHPADDTVCRVIAGAPRPLRIGRGIAPLELPLPRHLDQPLLAVGGHLKTTVALAWGERAVLSPHIGDLDGPRARAAFAATIEDLQALYGVRARRLVCDAHPGYASRQWARRRGLPVTEVLHHHAHASALAGEHPGVGRWLVFTWDGIGYGADGTLWGGEGLLGAPGGWRRVASFRPFRLPGGDKTGREPWRSAAALCWELGLACPVCPAEAELLHQAWTRRLNCPQTTSVGRLFDAAAALTGLVRHASFEGQGPMWLEAAAAGVETGPPLPLVRRASGLWETDWAPLVPLLLDGTRPVGERAGRFHAALAQALAAQARAVRAQHGDCVIGLCGGVFQNRLLTERAVAVLERLGFDVRLPRRLPGNDAGLSYGQIVEAAARQK